MNRVERALLPFGFCRYGQAGMSARSTQGPTMKCREKLYPFTSAITCSGYRSPAAACCGNTSSIRRKSSLVSFT